MVLCAAVGCNNDSRRTTGISYYKIQSRAVDIQKKWLINIRRKNYVATAHSCICSDHFEEGCFVRDLQAELLNIKRPRRVKDDALPTIFNHDMKSLPTKRRLHTEKTASESKTNKIGVSKSGNKYIRRKFKKGSLPTLNLVTGTKKLKPKKTNDDKTLHQCVVCDVIFEEYRDLEVHNKIHVKVEKTVKEENIDSIVNLQKTHVKDEKIDAKKLNTIHVEEGEINVGKLSKIHVKEEKIDSLNFFQCNLCDRKFELYADLEEHCKIHVKEEDSPNIGQNVKKSESIANTLYQCTICHICFKQYSELEEHCKTHTRRSHQCKFCKLSFKQYIDLEAHYKLHVEKSDSTESTPRQCSVCKKDFIRFTDIAVHLKTCGNICLDERKEIVIHLRTGWSRNEINLL